MRLTHEELVAELVKLEDLPASQRKQLNDQRRAVQLDRWHEEDTESVPLERPGKRKKTDRAANFDPGLILLNCAATGDIDGVRRVLNQGIEPTVYNVDRITPLHACCLENNEEIAELLIKAGCLIDALDNELWTPLHAAVSMSCTECVEILLEHGASQLAPNVDGALPMDLCEDREIIQIIEQDILTKGITQADITKARASQGTKCMTDVHYLVSMGTDLNTVYLDNGATLLHVAAANGYVEVALFLLSKLATVDAPDIDGWTPLHAAAFWGEVDIIELLAAHDANFKMRTFCGELPSDLTEDEDIRNLLQRLSERSDLLKRLPNSQLRPSSVRGRLVSRMTTDAKEDKRRESAELHSIYIDQINGDLIKPPKSDSLTLREKYCRPSLRDISFDTTPSPEIAEPVKPLVSSDEDPDIYDMSEQRKGVLERTMSESGLEGDIPELNVLSAISESHENKSPKPTPKGSPASFQLRKEKSVDNLSIADGLESETGSGAEEEEEGVLISRTSSLHHTRKADEERNAVRYYSFRKMNDLKPSKYSPKPGNSRNAYKNRKKGVKHSNSADDSDKSPNSAEDVSDVMAKVPHLIDKVDDGHQSDTVNSMATFAGSDACHEPMESVEDAKKTKKKNKCCVIL